MKPVILNYALVAMGGAMGAMARMGAGHLVSAVAGTRYPWHTFTINVSGSLLLGFVATWLGVRAGGHVAAVNHVIAIGFLGAYTTFSTFELETWNLLSAGRTAAAIGYAVSSLLVGVVAIGAGVWIARAMA